MNRSEISEKLEDLLLEYLDKYDMMEFIKMKNEAERNRYYYHFYVDWDALYGKEYKGVHLVINLPFYNKYPQPPKEFSRDMKSYIKRVKSQLKINVKEKPYLHFRPHLDFNWSFHASFAVE
jgi:hypothetical protein